MYKQQQRVRRFQAYFANREMVCHVFHLQILVLVKDTAAALQFKQLKH